MYFLCLVIWQMKSDKQWNCARVLLCALYVHWFSGGGLCLHERTSTCMCMQMPQCLCVYMWEFSQVHLRWCFIITEPCCNDHTLHTALINKAGSPVGDALHTPSTLSSLALIHPLLMFFIKYISVLNGWEHTLHQCLNSCKCSNTSSPWLDCNHNPRVLTEVI